MGTLNGIAAADSVGGERPEYRSGPDPKRVDGLDDLARELGLLRARAARGTRSARVSVDELASRLGEPKSTIHAYMTGRRLAPAELLDRIVIALGSSAAEQREWAEAWYRVGASRDAGHRVIATAPLRPAVPQQLPLAIDAFTGRDAALRQLDRLAPSGCTVICGTAGVGKSALAVHWAQHRRDRFPDGQLYLDLHGFDLAPALPTGQALGRLLRVVGPVGAQFARESEERAAQYRSVLAGRRMLIVLDNARDTEQVSVLLPGSGSCAVLVTSRDSMAGLVARHGARRIELDVLPPEDAADLLRTLMGPVPLSRVAGRGFAALADRCARLPLALRIAAELGTRYRRDPGELAADLAAGPGELDLLEADDDPRSALRTVFSWSYERLPEPAARAFRLLGLHDAGAEITPTAVGALLGVAASDATRVVARLSGAHLIQLSRPGRFGMHALLRSYAHELALAIDSEATRRSAIDRLSRIADVPAVRSWHHA
jgi:transcriptional regulator with XRE-family HTH domain